MHFPLAFRTFSGMAKMAGISAPDAAEKFISADHEAGKTIEHVQPVFKYQDKCYQTLQGSYKTYPRPVAGVQGGGM